MKRLFLSFSLLAPGGALAQPFSIQWHQISHGGGTSTGGAYSVSGTPGQPIAGIMSGGNFTAEGGLLGIVAAVQTPGSPLLKVQYTGTKVIVSWPSPSTGFVLQQNSGITTTNWTDYGGTVGDDGTLKSVTNSLEMGNRFFRLKK